MVTLPRATEEAAIAAFIAARGVTRLPEVDPVERALEIWRAQREDGLQGMRATVAGSKKRGRPRKIRTVPQQPHGKDDTPQSAAFTAQSREAVPDAPQGNTAPAAEPPIITALAYALWEMEGRRHGADMRHWLTAEAIIIGDASWIGPRSCRDFAPGLQQPLSSVRFGIEISGTTSLNCNRT